jgi:hypothetical protein
MCENLRKLSHHFASVFTKQPWVQQNLRIYLGLGYLEISSSSALWPVEDTSLCPRGSPFSSRSPAACSFWLSMRVQTLLASEQSLLGVVCIDLSTLVSP